MNNPYITLEIPQDSSQIDIKRAFRNKAKMYHPDVCKEKNASEKFKLILGAYELLKENNWKWNNKDIKQVDLDKIYKDHVKNRQTFITFLGSESILPYGTIVLSKGLVKNFERDVIFNGNFLSFSSDMEYFASREHSSQKICPR